jgi:hypothetical protein
MQYGLRLLRQVGMPLLALATSACYRPAADARAGGSWTFEVEAPPDGSRTLVVEATFDNARTERIAVARDSTPFVRDVLVRTGGGFRTVERRGREWFEPSCLRHCTIRYRIDLGELASACGDEVDCARRVNETTLSPSLAWLIHPVPRTDVPVFVRVQGATPSTFASGMQARDESGTSFTFRSYDLDEGSFTAFGPVRRYRIDVARGAIDVVILGKTRYAMNDEAIKSWVEEAAGVVTPLFGRFPVDHATLFVVPAKGEDEVVFGKVLSLAGASVALVVGDRMQEQSRHRDWVLVHELFHLGFPTFRGEGRWLGEGLATYYEPVLRARAGWTSAPEIFGQFARNMPRGMPSRGSSAGLASREDLDSIYWGGALFCFTADVRIRQETKGKKSLDDVMRAALSQGGDSTRVWSVADVVRLGDEVTGTAVLSDMYRQYAARGDRIDLDGLLAALGVERNDDGVVALDDSRPLAWVRKEIVGSRQLTNTAALRHPPPSQP